MILVKEAQFRFPEATSTRSMDPQLHSHSVDSVVYLVIKTDLGTNVQFVVIKTRVAPLQTQTIPRLELLSALLLSRLIVSVSESLQPTMPQLKLQCYTDSQIALYWICGTSR